MKGQILIISGPSGSGKSTLLSRLMSEFDNIYFSISSTTRMPRDGEQDGVDYNFISVDEFKKGIDEGKFLEWANVHKNYYGTSLEPVEKALKDGKIVIFDIDVQGFYLVMKKYSSIITSVFITTKDRYELKRRLINRGSDDAQTIENRLFNAATEIAHIGEYDYLIINENIDKSYDCLKSIFVSMGSKSQSFDINEVIESWNEC
ncbi:MULTISPECIES: guanylate kinase [Campylobacter]|uniref:Guanylate kinase n=1 Tax=Campylobacter porcelli TaxID=1660073 RepID=A0A1X9SVC8_9BACT|nr:MULTISPECIES: guanylate kinase [unclassified Campylobacter]ARR00205.1 deoxyguanylate kinase / guanylate kinase [Campylobacter sp. RM6137]MCR8679008.1 guanylate kinase [Campylobacter sp. RM19072]MCR8696248.1 guanylate kinase [Campylobacter sp. RM19073]MEE3744508.1 guanylate kinase [Campylobacter sp. CX2-4855-23]